MIAGDNLFVANVDGGDEFTGSLTELNASTGALVRVISGPAYNFYLLGGMALAGEDLFVANYPAIRAGLSGTGSVSESDGPTGALEVSSQARRTPSRAPWPCQGTTSSWRVTAGSPSSTRRRECW